MLNEYCGISQVDNFTAISFYDNLVYYTKYNPNKKDDIYYDIILVDRDTNSVRTVNSIPHATVIKIYQLDNGLVCGIIGQSGSTNTLYISTDKPEFLFFNVSSVIFPEQIRFNNGNTTIVKDEKLMVSGKYIYTVDIGNDIGEFYEGSFYVESGRDIMINTPFIPDHVFISLAQSDNINSKYLYSEIHRTDIIELYGSIYNSITIFDGSEGHLIYRSDNATTILNNGFSFSNNTMNDRHLNFIAIKENRYE